MQVFLENRNVIFIVFIAFIAKDFVYSSALD